MAYTADGAFLLAGGISKFVCIYSIGSRTLVKKFQLSHNRSLEGIQDELRSDRLVDGIALDNLAPDDDSDDEHIAKSVLPGAKTDGADGSRTTRPQMLTAALRFSSSGREWAAATTQGLQVFSLDNEMLFAPTDLDVNLTPDAVRAALGRGEPGLALNMALHLGLSEKAVLKLAVDAVDVETMELVVKGVDVRLLHSLMRFLADEIVASRHTEYYLRWSLAVLRTHGKALYSDSMAHNEALRALIRAVSTHEKEIMRRSDENQYALSYLSSQLELSEAHEQLRPIEAGEQVESQELELASSVPPEDGHNKAKAAQIPASEKKKTKKSQKEKLGGEGDETTMSLEMDALQGAGHILGLDAGRTSTPEAEKEPIGEAQGSDFTEKKTRSKAKGKVKATPPKKEVSSGRKKRKTNTST